MLDKICAGIVISLIYFGFRSTEKVDEEQLKSMLRPKKIWPEGTEPMSHEEFEELITDQHLGKNH